MSVYDDMKERKKERRSELLLSEDNYKYTKKRN